MATLLLLGSNEALLEGLMQALSSAGHRTRVAYTLDEAEEIAVAVRPLMIVAERSLIVADSDSLTAGRLPFAAGGALVLYREHGDEGASVGLPHALARVTLADLTLPLERQRLLALAQYVEARARESGRGESDTPPAHPAM